MRPYMVCDLDIYLCCKLCKMDFLIYDLLCSQYYQLLICAVSLTKPHILAIDNIDYIIGHKLGNPFYIIYSINKYQGRTPYMVSFWLIHFNNL